ncbi:MAG: D-alanyl-D-alanine carboxypeptidase [Deltaproteobacteria bacterium]|nr:D-alanyl-D-alanine carboxypeptidase [Deltaproteobacteria bacterium]
MAVLKRHRQLGVFLLPLLFLLPAGIAFASGFPEAELTARAAFVMDAASGHVLYERQPDLPLPPASTTKVLTAIVALESDLRGKELLRASKSAARVPYARLHLRPGQAMSLNDLLYSILLASANDASLVVAEGIGRSVERFAEMMTEKAREIGARSSRFVNPHGLTAPGHYSTARDLAVIFRYALHNPTFREIIQTKTSSVNAYASVDRPKRARHIQIRNHNRLLWTFDGTIGGKTGYTLAAQKTFVGAVSRNGSTLIVSVLGARDLWGDARRLLEYGFENHDGRSVDNRKPDAPAALDEQLILSRPKPSSPLLSWEEEKQLRSASGYLLQVASFRERDRAEALQKIILEGGREAFLERALLSNGEVTFRVRVGPYHELTDAQNAAREVESQSGFRPIIIPADGAKKPS